MPLVKIILNNKVERDRKLVDATRTLTLKTLKDLTANPIIYKYPTQTNLETKLSLSYCQLCGYKQLIAT